MLANLAPLPPKEKRLQLALQRSINTSTRKSGHIRGLGLPATLQMQQMSLQWMFKACAQPTECEHQRFFEGFDKMACRPPPPNTGMPIPLRKEETWPRPLALGGVQLHVIPLLEPGKIQRARSPSSRWRLSTDYQSSGAEDALRPSLPPASGSVSSTPAVPLPPPQGSGRPPAHYEAHASLRHRQ